MGPRVLREDCSDRLPTSNMEHWNADALDTERLGNQASDMGRSVGWVGECCSGFNATGYYWRRNSAVGANRVSGSLGIDEAECASSIDGYKKGQCGMRCPGTRRAIWRSR